MGSLYSAKSQKAIDDAAAAQREKDLLAAKKVSSFGHVLKDSEVVRNTAIDAVKADAAKVAATTQLPLRANKEYAEAARSEAIDAVKPAVAANSKLKTRRSGLGDISYTEE